MGKRRTSRRISLSSLHRGVPAISADYGKTCAQAGTVCLDNRGHNSPTKLRVSGIKSEAFRLSWPYPSTRDVRCWNDLQDATEFGAYALAFLLVKKLTRFTAIERSRKGTGFDYWLGKNVGPPFQKKARLEVSGILSGTDSQVSTRVKEKLRQTAPSAGRLPAFVVVAEFGQPASQVVRQ